jgi:voltage-gated potassium channel
MIKEIKRILFLVLLLLVVGSTGYSLLEDANLFDSLYMTVITLSTTGYKEVFPLSWAGKVLTMILIIIGITIFLYALREINLLIFEGKFFQERKMQKKINELENHYIICGYGRMGTKIAQELRKRNKPFVILEKDLENPEDLENYQYIAGDATEDENLIKAGILKAKGLVSVLRTDIANTFTTLSARGLNPSLKIIARAEEESSKEKLIKAGASRVVLPYEIGGYRITQALLRPTVVDFIDEVFSRSDLGLEIEEVNIKKSSNFNGKSIAESKIRSDFNTIIVGIYRESGKLIYNPGSETMIEEGDDLIVIGEREKLDKLQEKANEN